MFIMKFKILFIPLYFIFSLSYGQTEVCSFDENLYSGTVSILSAGGTKIKASDATSNYRFGERVAIDGSSPLSFSLTENNDVYISINHRSHLGILTATSVILSESGTTIDFTADTSLVYGNSNAVIALSNGAYGLISGDFDGNGQVQNIDVNGIITLLGSSGYNGADMDMNGQIQNSDINNLINPNSGKGEQF